MLLPSVFARASLTSALVACCVIGGGDGGRSSPIRPIPLPAPFPPGELALDGGSAGHPSCRRFVHRPRHRKRRIEQRRNSLRPRRNPRLNAAPSVYSLGHFDRQSDISAWRWVWHQRKMHDDAENVNCVIDGMTELSSYTRTQITHHPPPANPRSNP